MKRIVKWFPVIYITTAVVAVPISVFYFKARDVIAPPVVTPPPVTVYTPKIYVKDIYRFEAIGKQGIDGLGAIFILKDRENPENCYLAGPGSNIVPLASC